MFKNLLFILNGYISFFKYILNKKYRLRIEHESKRRLDICNACIFYDKRIEICKLCGCFMKIKTKIIFKLDNSGKSINGCPKQYW